MELRDKTCESSVTQQLALHSGSCVAGLYLADGVMGIGVALLLVLRQLSPSHQR